MEEIVTNPRSCRWSPDSSAFILWTEETVFTSVLLSLLHAHTDGFVLGRKSTYPYNLILQGGREEETYGVSNAHNTLSVPFTVCVV